MEGERDVEGANNVVTGKGRKGETDGMDGCREGKRTTTQGRGTHKTRLGKKIEKRKEEEHGVTT